MPALRQAYTERFLGRSLDVVWEEEVAGFWRGCSDNYVRVYVKSDTIMEGTVRAVRILEPYGDGVLGELTDGA